MIYSVKITTADGGQVIEIGKKSSEEETGKIKKIDIKFDTINDNALQRSNAILARIVIEGEIENATQDELMKIFKWAYTSKSDEWYRKIEIEVRESSEGKRIRSYTFDKVFVLDYNEHYIADENDTKSSFELILNQKENSFSTIETY